MEAFWYWLIAIAALAAILALAFMIFWITGGSFSFAIKSGMASDKKKNMNINRTLQGPFQVITRPALASIAVEAPASDSLEAAGWPSMQSALGEEIDKRRGKGRGNDVDLSISPIMLEYANGGVGAPSVIGIASTQYAAPPSIGDIGTGTTA